MAEQIYSRGILSEPIDLDGGTKRTGYPKVEGHPGIEVFHDASGFAAVVIDCTEEAVVLRDDGGRDRRVRNFAGAFVHEGRRVTLTVPRRAPVTPTTFVTASGSIAGAVTPARVARPSRILVEGLHDAELIERVWGDDLRGEGIVVEPMHGADDVGEIVRAFGPRPGRRLGILLDHLVANSKETRLASQVDHPDVMIRGHRFVDVWAAIDPRLAGLDSWPDIPRSMVWKDGICAAVGVAEPRGFWRQLLAKVESYKDLDPSLVGAVEELIDFVCE